MCLFFFLNYNIVMNKINILGIDINYKIEKTGKPILLFIHGYESSQEIINPIIKLKRSYDIVSLDLPGFGKSNFIGKVSIEFYAEIIKEFINELKLENLTLLGHSMGGAISMFVSKSDKIKKIILINPLNPFTYSTSKEKITPALMAKEIIERSKNKLKSQNVIGLFSMALDYKNKNKYLIHNQFLNNGWQSNELHDAYKDGAFKAIGISSSDDRVVLPLSIEKTQKFFGIKFMELKNASHSPFDKEANKINDFIEESMRKL